jgi:hypothetical protein
MLTVFKCWNFHCGEHSLLWSSGLSRRPFKEYGGSIFRNLVCKVRISDGHFISFCLYILIPLIPYSSGVEVFIFVLIYTQSVGLLGRVIEPSQGLYLNTGQHKHRINAHTHTHTSNIHALSGVRTHDHSVWASEDRYRDRPLHSIPFPILYSLLSNFRRCLAWTLTVSLITL